MFGAETGRMSGRRCVVITGASSGIGKASAQAFARMGWHVIGTGRDEARCEAATRDLAAHASRTARIDIVRGNFTEMHDVLRISEDIISLTDRVDILVNNAGGVRDGYYRTSEGMEATFCANHLSAFLLTRALRPLLERAAESSQKPNETRVISVASSAHETCEGMRWDDLMMHGEFDTQTAFAQAKLANLLFTRELNRRLQAHGIAAYAMDPGRVASNFASHGDSHVRASLIQNPGVPPEQPARTVIWLATAAELATMGGRYFRDLIEVQPGPQALDDLAASRLWIESEQLVDRILRNAQPRNAQLA